MYAFVACISCVIMLQNLCMAATPTGIDAATGFTQNTIIHIELQFHDIDRLDWWLTHGFTYNMPTTISVTNGTGTEGGSNKIMLYGDRCTPLLAGEPDWQLTPRPRNIYFTPTQTSLDYTVPYGPPYCPQNTEAWFQDYVYSVHCYRVNSTSVSDSDTLRVRDSL